MAFVRRILDHLRNRCPYLDSGARLYDSRTTGWYNLRDIGSSEKYPYLWDDNS